MKIKELLPWNWRKNDVPVRREYMFESIATFPRIGKCAAAHLRYLGCKQKLRVAVNDRLGIEPDESL